MKTLTTSQTQQVSGGAFFNIVRWIIQEVMFAAIDDILSGNMQALGERENRPVGTRP